MPAIGFGMGWEHDRYAAQCAACGQSGVVVISSDDWGRQARRYEGFENIEPDPTAVGRLRQDPRQMNGKCSCGSTDIPRGELIP